MFQLVVEAELTGKLSDADIKALIRYLVGLLILLLSLSLGTAKLPQSQPIPEVFDSPLGVTNPSLQE